MKVIQHAGNRAGQVVDMVPAVAIPLIREGRVTAENIAHQQLYGPAPKVKQKRKRRKKVA